MEQIADIKSIFIGTPEFGAIVLDEVVNAGLKPSLVLTSLDKPVGRKQLLTKPAVKIIAEKHGIPILQAEKMADAKDKIQNINPDVILVAAFGKILPKEILEIPKHGALNLHPSLLPRWRGASPIQHTILSGDTETGATIILMDDKIDHGPIVAAKKYEGDLSTISYKDLEKELAELGAKLMIETVPKWVSGKIKPEPQEEDLATYTNVLRKEDGRIIWKNWAKEIERQIRAFSFWPGTYCIWPENDEVKQIKILKVCVQAQKDHGPFGVLGKTFMATNEQIAVQCGKDFLIIEELQMEGKKPMKVRDFLNGHPDFIGKILE